MKQIKIFITALFIMALAGCSKDFLDMKPTNSIDADKSINTAADANRAMIGLMSDMRAAAYYGRNFILYADVKGGDLAVYSAGRGLDGLYTFNHSPSVGAYGSYWNWMYQCILQANNIIKRIDALKTGGSTENFDRTLGQALTLRAQIYFDLVRLYGKPYTMDKTAWGVPNVLEPLPSGAQPLRATVEDNYTQIMKDLTDAAPLLPKTVLNGYVNYYVNMALQAKVNLYMGNTTDALTAAQTVINDNVYKLYTNAEWVPSWTKQFGSESIFEIVIDPINDLGTGSLGYYLRRKGHGGSAALGWFMASDYFLARLGEDPADVRWGVMAADESDASHLGASYKYSGSVTLDGDGKGNSSAVNVKVMRLSEVYLIAAEAALPTDKEQAAIYLNAIRKRSPNLAPATETTIDIDMILDERSKELFTEGDRFFDLMRLNKTVTYNDEFGLVPNVHRPKTIDRTFFKTILPISQDEINANPGLAAQQNSGY